MKIICDAQVDVLRSLFSNAAIEDSDEEKAGIILDFTKSEISWEWKSWTHPSGWKTRGQWRMPLPDRIAPV